MENYGTYAPYTPYKQTLPDFRPFNPDTFNPQYKPDMKDSGSNPVYKNCPAIMEDGRFITYYNSTNELTHHIQELNGIKSSNQFRTFLQKNADIVMNKEREYINKKYSCRPNIACSEGYLYVNQRYDE
jgi:hypothetical protein